jgi:uncharacterized iron-regulated membrane protein
MAQQPILRQLARWHIWLGWLIAVPLLMWTITGLVMVSRPIDEVRGEHLRQSHQAPLPPGSSYSIRLPARPLQPITDARVRMQGGAAVTLVTYEDGSIERIGADGTPLPPFTESDARALVARNIQGGDKATAARLFMADQVPLAFRRPMPVWQIVLESGTHVYVGQRSGAIEAIRTSFWWVFDVMWGLHIMDLNGREDTHHPLLILFAALSVLGVLIGTVLLFRRRGKGSANPAR